MVWEDIRREVAGNRVFAATSYPSVASSILPFALPMEKRLAPPRMRDS